MKRILALLLCAVFLLGASACKSEKGKTNSNKEVELVVDLHGWMPTLNSEPTAENPKVFVSTQKIADAFMEKNPNIKIKWARTKPVGGLATELAEWFTTQINAGTVPAIAFSWGTKFQDRGWYLPLDEYLDKANPYIKDNKKWRDIFPSYLWTNAGIADINKKVVAIPVALYPGAATGYYYNKSAFTACGITTPPKTYEELIKAIDQFKAKGYTGIAPWGYFKSITADQWIMQFTIGPSAAGYIMNKTDYNKDGQVTTDEQLRGVKAGLYNPVDKPYAQEVFKQLKRYYTTVLGAGWESSDYNGPWNQGKVAIKEEGLWALQNENNNKGRTFDYGVFPAPLMTTDTTQYASKIEYTEKGPYQPDPDLQLNIMKDAVKNDPEKLDAAVKFLQYLTVPENVSMMVIEQGADIGAVKGTQVPPLLKDWVNNSFAKVPKANWPLAFTDEDNLSLNKAVETWVKNGMSDSDFYKKINELQLKGADSYIKSMKIDTSKW